jgi:hypothetical protein
MAFGSREEQILNAVVKATCPEMGLPYAAVVSFTPNEKALNAVQTRIMSTCLQDKFVAIQSKLK